ncbi:hypothetical protein AAG570_005181 [Ranatra chinensis]|uniref:Reverse transcriptase domain-containing protein n=1 Tax=Ranatra chinensis TaxID=642074 RepID=A0ABD0XZN9_9HEMI
MGLHPTPASHLPSHFRRSAAYHQIPHFKNEASLESVMAKNHNQISNPDGTWAKSDSEIANLFGTHLSNIFVPHPDNPDPTHTRTVLNDLDSPLPMSVPPPAFSPSEVKYAISKLPTKKAPGFDLITSTILRQLPKKAILFLTYIYNSVLRTTYFPLLRKFSQIKMIPKPNKPAKLPSSYRPISLLPLLGKLLEELLYKRLVILLDPIIPDHQFGFRNSHSTIQQCQRVVDNIASCLEQKQYCSAAFLDVAQAFDRVWHRGLLWKIKSLVPSTYCLILLSYLSDPSFIVIHGSSQSPYFPIKAGVPQGSILSPLLYSLYTSDVPQHPATLLASFAHDTAILSTNSDPTPASLNLQSHLTTLQTWCSNWKIRLNPQKWFPVTFTLRHSSCPPVYWHRTQLPPAKVVRYFGLYIDRTLTWNPHTRLKRQETNRRYKLLQRLLDKRSKLRTENKLLVYNSIIKPIWAYGAEIWGSAKPSNVNRIQTLQSKILRRIVDAPPYVSNLTIHTDLKIPFVKDFIATRYRKFHSKLYSQPNPLVKKLSSTTLPDNPPRRLKRHWPRDFLQMDLYLSHLIGSTRKPPVPWEVETELGKDDLGAASMYSPHERSRAEKVFGPNNLSKIGRNEDPLRDWVPPFCGDKHEATGVKVEVKTDNPVPNKR